MVYYSIVAVIPTSNNMDWLNEYIPVAERLTEAYGGKLLTGHDWEQIEGQQDAAMDRQAMQVLIQWPSKQAALDFMDDPAYQPALELRTRETSSVHYLVAGSDEDEEGGVVAASASDADKKEEESKETDQKSVES